MGFASEQHHCAAPRTNVPRAWIKNTALNEKRTVMQQSEQPCDRVKPRTNLPSTACSSKCPASREIVPLTTNALPQKHRRGVRGPPTPIVTMMVMFFALRSDCPPLRSQKGADPTQMASKMPEWNQAHRAHQQTEHGGRISNSIAHCVVRTMFQK